MQTDLTDREILQLAAQINIMYETQMQKEIAMQKRERRLKEVLTNISHDIRTPLTSLKGYFELFIEEEDEVKRKSYIDVIRRRTEDLSDLLEELFTYTKLQNEAYVLEMKKQNFTKILLECLFSFHEQFKEKKIEPQLEIAEQPFNIICNDVAVRRVISNILRNALLHGNGLTQIRYEIQGEKAYFCCKNGIENPEEIDIERVFEQFYKADVVRSGKSNGLGLSIAKELVEKMGGKIEAHLEESLFVVELWL